MKENKTSLTQFLLLLIFIVFTIGFTLSYNELHNFNMIQRSRFVQDISVYFTNNVKDSAIASDLSFKLSAAETGFTSVLA